MLVEPGSPPGSYLLDKLMGVGLCSGSVMPKTGSISDAEIDVISAWICQGALDD